MKLWRVLDWTKRLLWCLSHCGVMMWDCTNSESIWATFVLFPLIAPAQPDLLLCGPLFTWICYCKSQIDLKKKCDFGISGATFVLLLLIAPTQPDLLLCGALFTRIWCAIVKLATFVWFGLVCVWLHRVKLNHFMWFSWHCIVRLNFSVFVWLSSIG